MERHKLIGGGSNSAGGSCGKASGPSICGGDVDGNDVVVGVVVMDGSDNDPGEHGGMG